MSKQLKSRELNPLARDRLAELLKKTGHQLQPNDFGYIDRLNSLAERVTSAADKDEQDLLNIPVPCGNVVLRKPSIGKLCWFNQSAIKWFADNPSLCDLAFAYLLALPNEEGAIDNLVDPETSAEIIGKWAVGLTCTESEFDRALARVYPTTSEGGDDGEGESRYGPTIALLAREYGGKPTWWIWEAPTSMIQEMLNCYRERMEAEHAAQLRASRSSRGFHKGGSHKPVTPARTPTADSLKELREFVSALEIEWSSNDG